MIKDKSPKEEPKIEEKNVVKRKGVVVSDKGDKTLVVEVTTLRTHKKYQKQYRDTKKFKVHDEENKCKVGDKIEFVETRPISKDKKWKVL